MPLYDLLNEFQKGHSHMAAVVKQLGDAELSTDENSVHGRSLIFFSFKYYALLLFLSIVYPRI